MSSGLKTLSAFFIFVSLLSRLQQDIVAEEFVPEWGKTPPQKRVDFEYDAKASSEKNGERLRITCEKLEPGVRLVLSEGEYSVERLWKWNQSGTKSEPIWIEAKEGAKVVLTRPDARQNILNVGGDREVSFVRFHRLVFRGGSHGVRLQQCSDIWFDECEILETADVALSANSANTSRLFITRNTIHDTHGTGEGMYLGGNNGSVVMSESVIAQNHVYNCGGDQGDGIEVKQGSWGNRIVENKVHDCNYPCITVYGTNGKARNIIERNLCYNSRNNVMQVQGEALVRNNILVNGDNSAFASTDHQGKTKELEVVHNTIINRGHAFRGGSWNDRDGMVLANNVIYSLEGNALHFASGSGRVAINGNLIVGGKVPPGNKKGNGTEDFRDADWQGTKLEFEPKNRKLFETDFQVDSCEEDFTGKKRTKPILAGALN